MTMNSDALTGYNYGADVPTNAQANGKGGDDGRGGGPGSPDWVNRGTYDAMSANAMTNSANDQGLQIGALGQVAPTISNPYAQQSRAALAGLQGQQSATAAGMGQNIQQLGLEASGKGGPTAADYAFTQGLNQSVQQQQAMAASAAGGPGGALAARTAAGNASNMQQQGVGQLGAQKANEQFAAQQALTGAESAQAGVYQGQAGQAQAEYGLQQGTAQAQAAMIQAEQQQNQSASQGWAAAGLNQENAGLAATEGYSAAQAQEKGTAVNQEAVQNQQTQATVGAATSGAGIGLSALSALSDARQKEDIRHLDGTPNPYGDHPIAVMLGKVEPSAFRYKPEARAAANDDGREHVGVMAQDLERTPAGASIVKESPAGKVIDLPGAAGMSLAALAEHEHRLRALEGAANPYAERAS